MKKLLPLFLLFGCENPDLRVYVSAPEKGGIFRSQADELILYPDTKGYFCMNPVDFKTLIELCTNPPDRSLFNLN